MSMIEQTCQQGYSLTACHNWTPHNAVLY